MKRIKQGDEANRCAHKECREMDTKTEYGEMVRCVKCGMEMLKSNWVKLQEKLKGQNQNDWWDVSDNWIAVVYLSIYLFFLLFWWITL